MISNILTILFGALPLSAYLLLLIVRLLFI